jgi:mannose-6-phosphate isomerase-like protein (cupin superfamily)
MKTINLAQKFEKFDEHWTPKIIGELNDQFIKIAKLKDEFVWHSHEKEDELFIVQKGTLFMDFKDKTEIIKPGEIIIVPKGVEHRPRTNGEEVFIMLIEPKSTLHTGNVISDKTVTELEKI